MKQSVYNQPEYAAEGLERKFVRTKWTAFLILFLITAYCITSQIYMPIHLERQDLPEGLSVPANVYAEIPFRYLNHAASEEAMRKAEDATPDQYLKDENLTKKMLQDLDTIQQALLRRFQSINADNVVITQNELDEKSLDARVLKLSKEAVEAFHAAERESRLNACFESWKDVIRSGILPSDADFQKMILQYTPERTYAYAVPAKKMTTPEGLAAKIPADIFVYTPVEIKNDGPAKEEIIRLFSSIIVPNLKYDGTLTEAKRAEAAEAAKVYEYWSAGQILFPQGHKVTAEDVKLWNAYQADYKSHYDMGRITLKAVKSVGLVLALLVFISIYIFHIHPKVAQNGGEMWELCVVTVGTLLLMNLVARIYLRLAPDLNLPRFLVFLVLPLALPTILLSVIRGFRSAIYIGFFTSGIVAFSLDSSFQTMMTGLLVCGVAGYAVRFLSDYKKFFLRTFSACTLATAFAALTFVGDYLFYSTPETESTPVVQAQAGTAGAPSVAEQDDGKILGVQVFQPGTKRTKLSPIIQYRFYTILKGLILVPLASGFLTAFLGLLILFCLESVTPSNMTYQSFTDRNHPLLKELQQYAPGTYHHSEQVAQLAEQAANRINYDAFWRHKQNTANSRTQDGDHKSSPVIIIDPVRVQACALFHDIGKLYEPAIFTENMTPGTTDLHGMLTPKESAEAIIRHISKGIEYAKKYKLPPLIREAIASHHGTDLTAFFYTKSQKRDPDGTKKSDFQYSGPDPEDPVVALILLADSCEAAAKSLWSKKEEKEQAEGKATPEPPAPPVPPLSMEETIRNFVSNIIDQKVKSGLLDKAELTTRSLAIIKESFTDTLVNMYHKRPVYPNQDKMMKRSSETQEVRSL